MSNRKRAAFKKFIYFNIIVALFLFTSPLSAAEKLSIAGNAGLLSIGAESFLLDDGLKVILKKDSRTPTIALTLLVGTGSATEGEYSGTGITHFIEHMIFKGTADYSALAIENQFKALGAETNAFTGYDYTCFKLEAPAASLGQLLHLLSIIVSSPLFPEEEFQREKQVILREIDMGDDDPDKVLYKLLSQTMYAQHPYKNPVIGFSELFQQLQIDDLRNYYKKFYVPNNMVISVVGDIDTPVVLQTIKDTFGALKRSKFSCPVVAQEPHQLSSRRLYNNFDVSRPMLLIGFHSVPINSDELYSLDALANILGSGKTSRLYKALYDDKALVHSIVCYNYTPRDPGFFVISAILQSNSINKTVDAIKEEIEKIKQSLPKPGELDKTKAQVLSSYLNGLETQLGKADALATSFALTGDLDFAGKYVKGIECVTVDDISKVANKYLTEENMTIAALLPENYIDQDQPSQPIEAEKFSTVKETLNNGLVVLITENHAIPMCSAVVSIKGGLRAENEANNGILNLASSLLLKGTARYNKQQIAEQLESEGADLTPYSGNNSFGLSMTFMSEDLEKMLTLLSAVLLQLSFPDNELELLRKDAIAELDLLNDDIFQYTNIRLRKLLFQNHPYAYISSGNKDALANIKKDGIVEFYKKLCVAKNAVLSICGDIDPKAALDIIKGKFNDMPQGEAFQPDVFSADSPKLPLKQIENVDKKQAVVMIGFEGASMYNNDRHPLQVLSSIFSGSSGRLYSQIRQKEGLAYTLGTFGMVGLDKGMFVFYAATTPENADKVSKSIVSQIEQIKSEKLEDEEISAAKKILITKQQLSLQTNSSLAMQLGLDELYGLGYDYYKQYTERINSVTEKDVKAACKKYFNLSKSVTVITKPK
ncbi:MAG: pitrilysin family protein [Candidatus Omnitrophota bacterium]